MWLCLHKFETLDLLQSPSFLFTTTIHPLSSNKCSTAISLLHEGYSLCQIQSRTGLGKSTIGRIKKELNQDKENSNGDCSSKLSHWNKQTIMYQITTGRLDNAIQATKFINNIIPHPVYPQTVRNILKANNFHSVVKKKCPLLKRQHQINHLKFAKYHENWTVKDWKRVLLYGQMRPRSIGLSQMEGFIPGSRGEKIF